MPRLFPSLGRSSKEHARGDMYGQYDGYNAPRGYYDYGYAEQEPRHNRSAWSKVLSRKSTKKNYTGMDNASPTHHRGYQTTVEDYPEDPRMLLGIPTDESESFEDLLSGQHSDTAVPLVQRESSLTRLQQAFADHGTYAPALSAAPSASHGAPFYAPQPVPGISIGQPHVSAVNDMQGPAVLVNNSAPLHGVRPDIVHHSASYPSHQRAHRRHRERERSAPPRAHRDHPAYWEEPLDPREEPPVVVVVEHGKHGKKDKYYIIPGGAPVIFEDEDGNELTRVGDFSGRYKPPRRPRPVIVQDQYGREICRAGFSNDDQISVGSRDNYSHHSSRSAPADLRGRSTHQPHERRARTPHHQSPPSSSHRYASPDSYMNDPHYQPSRPRAGTRSSRDDPQAYYVDPRQDRSARSGRSGSSSDTLVRSSPRDAYDHHSSSSRTHDSRARERDYRPDERDRGRDYYRRDAHTSRRHRGRRNTSSGTASYHDDDGRRYRSRRYNYDDQYD
ncbi:hypothetical protein BD413DRAFT_54401 [Trametes elegans]|nr:hypothetical protein BD413DRAFT_54401 [Trametes elegans]